MSEFEKEFSEIDDAQYTRFSKQDRVIASYFWRTALKWVLSLPASGKCFAEDVDYFIEQELEETK